jgi:hypothetical protein
MQIRLVGTYLISVAVAVSSTADIPSLEAAACWVGLTKAGTVKADADATKVMRAAMRE